MTLKKSIKEFGTFLGKKESLLDRDFKHVAEKIMLHWGYDEFYPFIEKLLVNSRDYKRSGFPTQVAIEISELVSIHERIHPPKNRL